MSTKITARIPLQSPIGSEEPIGDSFPPGEAFWWKPVTFLLLLYIRQKSLPWAIRFPFASRRKNPTTFPGIMLSEMPCPQEIILPLVQLMCIMKMTDYMVYYIFGGKLPWQLNMN